MRRRNRSGANASQSLTTHAPLFVPRSLLAMLVGMAFTPGMSAHAVQLGEIVSRSSLGEPFAARIPVQLDAGEEFTSGCVTILPNPDASRGVPLPPRLRASIEIVSGRHYLALRNAIPNNEPVVGLRLEFTCNDNEARDYVVLVNPAAQEPQVAETPSTEPVAQARPAPERAVRPRRQVTSAKAKPAKQAAQSQESKSTPPPGEIQVTLHDNPFLLHPDFRPLDLARKAGTIEQPSENLRATTAATPAREEAVAAANERVRNLEAEVAGLRKQLELTQQAVGIKAAPQDGPNWTHILESVGKWVLYGAPPLLVLAGLFAWWRRRKLEEPIAPYPLQEGASNDRTKSPLPAPAPAHDYPSLQTPSEPTSAEWRRPQPAQAPQPAQEIDPVATLPEEIAAITLDHVVVLNEELVPTAEARTPDIEFNLDLDSPPRAAQETYFAGRFGGNSEDVSILHNIDTVIEQARSIFEDDNDPVKAADLLELAVALHPTDVRPWLALFAIYRRASLARQYAMLGEKFHNSFPEDSNWPTIQRLGREIDLGNPLYAAAGAAEGAEDPVGEEASQDVTDMWLDVPLDFTSVLLADELRDALTAGAAPSVPLAASGG